MNRFAWPTQTFWAPRSPADIEGDLAGSGFLVRAGDGFRFAMRDPPLRAGQRRSRWRGWRPEAELRLVPGGGGTLIEVKYELLEVMLLFTVMFGLMTFGITWVMGFVAFQDGKGQVAKVLKEASGATLEGVEALAKMSASVADPRGLEADAGAPYSLGARSTLEQTRFTLRTAAGWVLLEVSASGISLRDALVEDFSWERLVEVACREVSPGPVLELRLDDGRSVEIVATGHPVADITWLAETLRARDGRWSASPEERERARQAQARLGAMKA